jgi:hypothetical protein
MLPCVKGMASLVAFGVAALVAVATGCGGDSGSADDYREQASALCRRSERAVERLPTPTTAQGFQRYVESTARLARKYDRDFKALEPPDDLRDEHRQLVRLSAEGERLLARLAAELGGARQTLGAIRDSLPDLERLARKSNALAERMDLPDCVQPLELPGSETNPA